MLKHILKAAITWAVLLIYRVAIIIPSPVLVFIGLFFEREVSSDRKRVWCTRTLSWNILNCWKLMQLPEVLWLWDNQRDGSMGDVRGNYWFEQRPGWIANLPNGLSRFMRKWWWLVVRNPVNNGSRFVKWAQCNLNTHWVGLAAGNYEVSYEYPGWQLCYADKWYYGFYYMSEWTLKGRKLEVRLGYKLKPQYNLPDYRMREDKQKLLKGFTFRSGFRGA